MVNTTKNRIDWLDIAKGLGILLVVLGHSGFPSKIQWWIWSFHMPLFFFISGFIYSTSKHKNFYDLFKRKNETLVLPYIIFSVLVFLLGYVFHIKGSDFKEVILQGWSSLALWFIPVLYLTELSFYWFEKYFKAYVLVVILSACSLLGYVLYLNKVGFPYKMEVVFTALVFYGLGYLFTVSFKRFFVNKKRRIYYAIPIFLLVNLLFCFANPVKMDLAFNIIGNYSYAYIAAIAGIFFHFFVSYSVTINPYIITTYGYKFLLYFGKNSLIILAIHQILKSILTLIFEEISGNHFALLIVRHALFWLLLILFTELINRYFYRFLGRKAPVVSPALVSN